MFCFRAFLRACLLLAFAYAGAAQAVSSGATIDMGHASPPSSGTGWTYAGDVYTITNNANVSVTGSNAGSQRRIAVAAGATATITLNYASITGLGDGQSPLSLGALSGAKVTLILVDGSINTLTGGRYSAGIQAPNGTTLTLQGQTAGTGVLTATGGWSGTGIGGGNNSAGGTITIHGGKVNATGGEAGAGIGSGRFGAGGTIIMIDGGTVTATGGESGAGIGGGYFGAGGTITISGGTVNATGGYWGAGIGSGFGGAGGAISISGNANVTAAGGDAKAVCVNCGSGAGIGSGGTDAATPVSAGTIFITTTGTVTATGGVGFGTSSRGANIGQGGYGAAGAGTTSAGIASMTHPKAQTATVGSTATFSCAATASGVTAALRPTLSYQWYRSTNGGASFSAIVNSTFTSYTSDATTAAMNGYQYRCRVTASGGGLVDGATISYSSKPATLTVTTMPVAPTITGPTAWILSPGYAATSTDAYTIGGTSPVTVTKTSGNSHITWNNATQKLDIAAGLAEGSYRVALRASNGVSPDATFMFTLTIVTYGPTRQYSGQWINTAEDAWGLSVLMNFSSDARYIFVPWYTYDSSGKPAWYVFQGNNWSANDKITAEVYRYRGSPWGTSPYNNGSVGYDVAGTATLTFTSATTAVFQYNVDGVSRTVYLDRLDGAPSAVGEYTGQWHNVNEDAWGLSVLRTFPSNANYVFVPWYTYDSSGKASWYLFQNSLSAGNTVTAEVRRYRGSPWGAPSYNNGSVGYDIAGTATLTFTSPTKATFQYNVDGVSRTIELEKL